MIEVSEKHGAVYLTVRVVPRASCSEVAGEMDGALKVRLASPPVEGAAHAELLKLVAKHFGVPKGNVEIVAGQTSKSKRIRIAGMNIVQLHKRLAEGDLPT